MNKSTITRTINRFEAAVHEKAFEGTIPWDCEAAIQAHEEIDLEYNRARAALTRLLLREVLS